MTNTRTLTEPLRGVNTLQQKHLAAAANDLCSQVAKIAGLSNTVSCRNNSSINSLIAILPHQSGCIGLLINSSS